MMTYIKVFVDFGNATRELSDAEKGRLFQAMLDYASGNVETPQFGGRESVLWPIVKAQIDRDIETYNRRSAANQINGSLGGQAKASEQKRIIANSSESKRTKANYSELLQDKDKDKEKDKDKDYITPPISPPAGGVFADFVKDNAELLKALTDFEAMRKKIKSPLTDRAKELLCRKLEKDYQPSEWVAVLEQSTLKGWKDIYPLKNEQRAVKEKPSNGVHVQRDYDAILAAAEERAAQIGKRKDG